MSFIENKFKEWAEIPLMFVQEVFDWTQVPQNGPSSQQIELFTNFNKGPRISIRSGHGCHAAGTIILMADGGCKLVEDIKVGDQLMGDDSTPRNVLELYRGREKMYRVQYHDGTYYDVNASHKLALRACRNKNGYTKGEIIIVPVKEYLDWNETSKRTCIGFKESIELSEIPVAIPPYILGLWLGDGWQDRPAFTTIDVEILLILRAYTRSLGLECKSYKDNKSHYLSSGQTGKAGQNQFLNALNMYELIDNKHIPNHYLLNSKENRLLLLAGLLDSDGWLDPRNKRVFEITQKREQLAQDIMFLAQSVGCHATIKKVQKSWTWNGEKKWGFYYKVNISRNTDIIPTQLLRKQVRIIKDGSDRKLNYGFTIIPLEVNEYYGFEVDANHLYMLSDFTVTRNTGKDADAAMLILWFMSSRAYPKVVCTAPTARQLSDILWSELSKWLRMSILKDEFIIQKDKLFHKDHPKEWWCRAVSPSVKATKEEQAETLAGFHGEHLLIVVDEASGVPDPVFIPLEGAMTQRDNHILLIGNMTKNTGYFWESHFHAELNKPWIKLHWDSRESTNVKDTYVTYMTEKYGVDSNVFRIRVIGDPPLEDERTLIPLHWAQQCVGNEIVVAEDEPLYLGVDVARYGEDKSIILPRQGLRIDPWETFQGMNTIELGGFIIQVHDDIEAEGVAIDEIGIGAGVTDWLHKLNRHNVHGVNVKWKSSDIMKFHMLRDELWLAMRNKCMHGLYSFPVGDLGDELCNELASPYYGFNAHGGFKVESKRDMKLRGVMSPNIADALGLTEYFYGAASRIWPKKKKSKEKKSTQPMPDNYRDAAADDQGWMAA